VLHECVERRECVKVMHAGVADSIVAWWGCDRLVAATACIAANWSHTIGAIPYASPRLLSGFFTQGVERVRA